MFNPLIKIAFSKLKIVYTVAPKSHSKDVGAYFLSDNLSAYTHVIAIK